MACTSSFTARISYFTLFCGGVGLINLFDPSGLHASVSDSLRFPGTRDRCIAKPLPTHDDLKAVDVLTYIHASSGI